MSAVTIYTSHQIFGCSQWDWWGM